MNPTAPRRKGWCPGALRPMETGDGLLARVRASGGRLTLGQAVAIAEAALACGNGLIGLSARGNPHLRGVSDKTLPDLHARLRAAGLIDADPEVERLRNIVASPLSDVDPAAAFDLAPSLALIEARLAEDSGLRALPSKFGFVLDAQGRLPLADIDADIRFEAARDEGGTTFAVYLAGEDAVAATCAPGDVGQVASRLARAFLSSARAWTDEATPLPLPARGERVGVRGSANERAPRMRAVVERIGASAIFAAAGLEVTPRPRSQRCTSLHEVLGGHVFGATIVVGAAMAFGGIEARKFKTLIERARELGASSLRLTPWRAFLVTGLNPSRAASIVAACAKLGLAASAREPRLRVAVCPGAPACMHALRPIREDAARFATHLREGEGIALHVSGCAKGCARPFATAATIVATKRGYDLVVNGKAGDEPVRRGLSATAVAALIAAEGGELFAETRPA